MRAVEGPAADDASYVASLVGLLAGPFQAASFRLGCNNYCLALSIEAF